jgi:transposase
MYSTEEKIQILHFYRANQSIRNVRDAFSVNYPDRPIPSIGTICNIISKFNNHGCVEYKHHKRNRTSYVLTEENKFNILCYVEENPMASLRMTSNYFEISCSSIRRVLKEFKYKPYKFTNHQQLSNEDKMKRTDFCEQMFNLINNNEEILEKIVFSDEASFSLDGEVNSQNYRLVFTDSTCYSTPVSFLLLFLTDIGRALIHTYKI